MEKAQTEWDGDVVKVCLVYRHKTKIAAGLLSICLAILLESLIPLCAIIIMPLFVQSDEHSNHRRRKSEGIHFSTIGDGKSDDIMYASTFVLLPQAITLYSTLTLSGARIEIAYISNALAIPIELGALCVFSQYNSRWITCYTLLSAKRLRKSGGYLREVVAIGVSLLFAVTSGYYSIMKFEQYEQVIEFPIALFLLYYSIIQARVVFLAVTHGKGARNVDK